jgi:pimeloyl-ACP methyl ester carboxylesterase
MNLLDTVWHDAMPGIPRPIKHICAITLSGCLVFAATTPEPKPLGKLADLGGHRLHVNCTGNGSPSVVVENGLGDFSFDWILVQSRVSLFTRICTYDRAGYAWSGPGPKPRTFAQLNLELRDALSKLGEQGPLVLVGHSYGGPAVRNFATTYPHEVAGIVLVDSSFEGQRVGIGGKAMMRLGDGAKGRSIPPPSEDMKESDKPLVKANATPQAQQPLDPMYNVLPPVEQKLQLWAQSLPEIEDAENSQREWSGEYFAKWLATSQAGKLGAIPLVVLTRAEGGYSDGDYDIPAAQLEKERNEGQAKLTLLSTNSKQVIVHSGHNMELQAPDDVTAAIREVVEAVRHHGKL